jgi:hypothetical protein
MRLLLATLALALAVATGCTSPCNQLADQICNCQTTQNNRNSCNAEESTRADQVSPTDAQEQACSNLIPLCDCNVLDTPQGKVNCGLAR